MRVLIACEFSGTVRDAFAKLGHDAISCDLLPSEKPGKHYQGDVFDVINEEWDLMIAHPPCTRLCCSGARWCVDHWVKRKTGDRWHDGAQNRQARDEAVEFARRLLSSNVRKIAVENPRGILSTAIRKPDQSIQPWQFGHGETKETHLWLMGLPKLQPTNIVDGRESRIHKMPPSKDRWAERSRTYQGVADAMAAQWGAT